MCKHPVQKTETCCQHPQKRSTQEANMLCPRVALSLLSLYWLIDSINAAALMTRNTREINRQDREPLLHQADNLDGDLSVGDAAENGRNSPTQIETPLATTQQSSTQHQNQFVYIRGKNEKRKKVIPLDSIGRFKI